MITYRFIINYNLLIIIKIARAVPSIKLKIGTLSVHVSAHGDALLPRASINTQ
jgi:hypothetical protein